MVLQEGAGFERFSPRPMSQDAVRASLGVLGQTGVEEGLCHERPPCPQSSRVVFVSYITAQDQERRTPLHAAAYIGDVAILELLILSGKGQGSGRLAPAPALPLGRLSDLWPEGRRAVLVTLQATVCSRLSQWDCSQGKIGKLCRNPQRFVQAERCLGTEIAEEETKPGGGMWARC